MIVLDIEATGVNPRIHSILSIGAIDFSNPQNQFSAECRIWDGAHIMQEALEVNGYTDSEIRDASKPTERDILEQFFHFALSSEEHTLAAHNPAFDTSFLIAAAERAGIDYPFAHRTLDLHTMTYFHSYKRGIMPPTKKGHTDINSNAVSTYVGIPTEPHPHIAIGGAKQAAECLSRLLNDSFLFPEFESFPIPWLNNATVLQLLPN